MTITISKLSNEHWNLRILNGDSELVNDSTPSKESAIQMVVRLLQDQDFVTFGLIGPGVMKKYSSSQKKFLKESL